MIWSIKSIELHHACLLLQTHRTKRLSPTPYITPALPPPTSLYHCSALRSCVAPFTWGLVYTHQVTRDQGLSVLMPQGSPRWLRPLIQENTHTYTRQASKAWQYLWHGLFLTFCSLKLKYTINIKKMYISVECSEVHRWWGTADVISQIYTHINNAE